MLHPTRAGHVPAAPTLAETTSADPVERALAAHALAVLRDESLSRVERVARIRTLQAALQRHRATRPAASPPLRKARHRKTGVVVDPVAARRRELRSDGPALAAPAAPTPRPARLPPPSSSVAPVSATTAARPAGRLTLRRS